MKNNDFTSWLITPILLVVTQQLLAGIKVTGAKQGLSSITVYAEAKSSAEKNEINLSEINELRPGGVGLEVEEDALNGRFLKVIINGDAKWIKTKQVKTDQIFNVGSCETKNKTTGVRGGINCTK